MAKLLVNSPSGEQELLDIDDTGSYFDAALVVWDERTDGTIPEIILGKMQRVGNELVTLADFLPVHAAAVYQKNFPLEVPMPAALEALINAELYDAVDAYMQTLGTVDRVWWQRADKINIYFPLVEKVRIALGLTKEQLEELFLAAEQIRKQRAGEI